MVVINLVQQIERPTHQAMFFVNENLHLYYKIEMMNKQPLDSAEIFDVWRPLDT